MGIFRPLSSEHERNGSILAYMLNDPKSQALFPLKSHGDFYSFIPSRLGRNLALDDTISCLCGIYADTLTNNPTTSEIAIRRYAKSLNSLRTCLEEPQLRTESETICASIILQLCEVSSWGHRSLAVGPLQTWSPTNRVSARDECGQWAVESSFKRLETPHSRLWTRKTCCPIRTRDA